MSTTDLAQQVADLTTATTKLTEEVVGQKDRLTAAADTATAKASDAAASAQVATTEADEAAISASNAASSANTAAQITGLDTVEEAVDMALSEFAGVMTASEHDAILAQNEEKYAASGFVHMGKHYSSGYVNEGIIAYSGASVGNNNFQLGRLDEYQGNTGSSKTELAVMHIAGSVIPNLQLDSIYETVMFHFPQAPDGTVIYDSTGDARGTGKANLNLLTEVDPKYGDIAATQNEAVARAFEGQVKNGDFRNGDDDWGSDRGGVVTVVDGVATVTGNTGWTTAKMWGTLDKFKAGKRYVASGLYHEGSGDLKISISDTSSIVLLTGSQNSADNPRAFNIEFDALADSNRAAYIYTIATAAMSISNISIKPVTEEVVTHPVDLVGLEYYEEELTGRQEVFECIQSLSSTFGTTSVPTVLSTRKLSYFQQYDGQFPEVTADPDYINDRYRCVVWDDLTEPQKREVAAYMGEKLFVGVNGHIVNGRLRARTIRGAGNGDWYNIDANRTDYLGDSRVFANYGANRDFSTFLMAQGMQDAPNGKDGVTSRRKSLASSWSGCGYPGKQGDRSTDGSVYKAVGYSYIAYQGRCFFYVVGLRA